MKMVTAIIKPFKVDTVIEALGDLDIRGVTVSEVRGFGRQGGHTEVYRGAEYKLEFLPKSRLDIVGVTSVPRVMRIRTGEEGPDAVLYR
jgi:nitrogen regulatory protein PII